MYPSFAWAIHPAAWCTFKPSSPLIFCNILDMYVDVGRRVLRTCCTAVQAGISDDKFPRRQQPGIAVVAVSTRGSPDSCIAPHTLANLFHELGHAFHHIIGSTAVLEWASCLVF
jgi:Zn-dependent oligopeptidase